MCVCIYVSLINQYFEEDNVPFINSCLLPFATDSCGRKFEPAKDITVLRYRINVLQANASEFLECFLVSGRSSTSEYMDVF